jgi:hypothetical protein
MTKSSLINNFLVTLVRIEVVSYSRAVFIFEHRNAIRGLHVNKS